MNRFASVLVKVSFDGPDIPEQVLYEIFRPYGRIREITYSGPVPAGSSRFATIHFFHIPSATVARNVLYGVDLPQSSSLTKIRTTYQPAIQTHAIRNWMSSHPKIVLPIIVFLLGTLTYTVRLHPSALCVIDAF